MKIVKIYKIKLKTGNGPIELFLDGFKYSRSTSTREMEASPTYTQKGKIFYKKASLERALIKAFVDVHKLEVVELVLKEKSVLNAMDLLPDELKIKQMLKMNPTKK